MLIVAGAVLVAGCLGLQYLPGSDMIRAFCTIGGAVLGGLMILSGAQGANLRNPPKWPGEP